MMAAISKEKWEGLLSGTLFAVRTHNSQIYGYAELVKLYVEQLKQEGIMPPTIASSNVTVEDAVNGILEATEHLSELANLLRAELRKSHGDNQ